MNPSIVALFIAVTVIIPVGVFVFQFNMRRYFARKCVQCSAQDLTEANCELLGYHVDKQRIGEKHRDAGIAYIHTREALTYHCNVCLQTSTVTVMQTRLIQGVFDHDLFNQAMLNQEAFTLEALTPEAFNQDTVCSQKLVIPGDFRTFQPIKVEDIDFSKQQLSQESLEQDQESQGNALGVVRK